MGGKASWHDGMYSRMSLGFVTCFSSHKGNVVFNWSGWVYLVWMSDSIIETIWQEPSSYEFCCSCNSHTFSDLYKL